MRKTHYLLLVVILFAFHVQSFAYGESEDEFDEIAGQLQGMKVVLENMETNYDSRLKNIQETYNTRLEEVQQKIAITPQFESQSFTSTIPPNDSPPGQTEKMPALPMDGL